MIDFEEITFQGKDLVKCMCDCGNEWYVEKEALSGCVKCEQCGTKSCSG